ncbi:bifunctional NUDIX hydrolase/phosphatase PAP2 family protein [Photobacterium minamisatsumaniensis]|uniref:bifunctional NUDIX hydrolase/phosphatase PAP2 family protein n=1 Tax=Photobacterium minamisatsumaniensis TaxID=2910233 RepID=UPI003D11BB8B
MSVSVTGMTRWLFVFLLCLASPFLSAQEENIKASETPEGIVGAVCVIRHDNKMVMLSEVITRKLSLPGGYIDKGDTPQQAAAREALEETGIHVTVADLIQYRGRAAIYSCVAQSPILVSSFRDYTGHLIVASWFSKHFATEVERVYLIDPEDVSAKEYRYAEDAQLLSAWLEKTPNSEILEYTDLSDRVNVLHQVELKAIKNLQHTVSEWPSIFSDTFNALMFVLNLSGEPWFVVALLLVVAGFWGPKALLELLFVLFLATFTSSLLKYGLASPRPSVIIPQLQKINAYGFGFPSGHTLLATLLWGIMWHVLSKVMANKYKYLLTAMVTFMIAGQALARVWYGVHFISDTVMSIMLGLVIVSVIIIWRSDIKSSYYAYLLNKWFWLSITIFVGIVASYTLVPVHAYLFTGGLGIFLTVDHIVKQSSNTVRLPWLQGVISFAVIAVGIAVLFWLIPYAASLSTVSLVVLAIKGTGSMLVAVWLVSSTAYLHRKYGHLKHERDKA